MKSQCGSTLISVPIAFMPSLPVSWHAQLGTAEKRQYETLMGNWQEHLLRHAVVSMRASMSKR